MGALEKTAAWRCGAGNGSYRACGFYTDALRNASLYSGLEMEMRKFVVGAAAAAMVAGSSIAQAAPVAPAATGDARVASSLGDAEPLRGAGGTHLMLGLVAAILLGIVLWQINDNDDDELPTSP